MRLTNSFLQTRGWAVLSALGSLLIGLGITMAIPRTIPMHGFAPDVFWPIPFFAGILLYVLPARDLGNYSRRLPLDLASVVCAILALTLLPAPYSLMAWPFFFLAALSLLRTKAARGFRYAIVLLTAGLAVGLLLLSYWQRYCAIHHQAPFLADLGSRLLSLRYETSHTNGNVFVSLGGDTYAFIASPYDVLPFAALIWLVLETPKIWIGRRLKGVFYLLATTFGFLFARWLFVALWGAISQDQTFRLDDIAAIATLVPLLALPMALQRGRSPSKIDQTETPSPGWKTAVPLMVGGAAIAFGALYFDPGVGKKGKVLVQEYNSEWEPTDWKLDTKIYGVRTVYNYVGLYRELGRYFDMNRSYGTLTDQALADVDVLILKTPTAPYTASELRVVQNFVERGGGVWLIGDHTNVFGMDTYLNQVGALFGLKFNADAVFDPVYSRQLYGGYQVVGHPIAKALQEPYLWYTSCSVRSPLNTDSVIMGQRVAIDKPNWSVNTFFGDFALESDEYLGPVQQSAAFQVGRGRIAAWADSTVFSVFSTYMPGQLEVAIKTVDWLNRSNSPIPVKTFMYLLGLGAVGFALWTSRRSLAWPAIFVCLATGVFVGVGSAGWLNSASYPMKNPVRDVRSVGFVVDKRSDALPLVYTSGNAENYSYLTSFVASSRVDVRPFVRFDYTSALQDEIIAIVGKSPVPTPDELKKIADWVRAGGRLLFLDTYEAKPWESILREAGFRTRPETEEKWRIVTLNRSGKQVGNDLMLASIQGGIPLLRSNGKTVAAMANLGKGQVLLSCTGGIFTDNSLGETSVIPNAAQADLLSILYKFYAP